MLVNDTVLKGFIATRPVFDLRVAIVTRQDAPGVTGIADMRERIIAVQRRGQGLAEVRAVHPQERVLLTDTPDEMLNAVVNGRAFAAVRGRRVG